MYLFTNTGSRTQPQFRRAGVIDLPNGFHYPPVLADLDSDADPDLLLGTWNEGMQVFRNMAGVDADGDLDLFVGEASGELNFLRNQNGHFVLKSEMSQNIDAGGRGAPALSDLDGDQDLFTSLLSGGVTFWNRQ